MIPGKWFIAAVLVLFALSSADAEFYKYVDKNGNIRFTDDITIVPPDQRAKLREYEESEETVQPARTSPSVEQEKEAPDEKKPAASGDLTEDALFDQSKQLGEKKAELEKEYRALMDERQRLESRKGEFRTRAAIKEYEASIRNLNKKNADFEKRREALRKEVEAFNQSSEAFYNSQKTEPQKSP
jgi:hypothetical protein